MQIGSVIKHLGSIAQLIHFSEDYVLARLHRSGQGVKAPSVERIIASLPADWRDLNLWCSIPRAVKQGRMRSPSFFVLRRAGPLNVIGGLILLLLCVSNQHARAELTSDGHDVDDFVARTISNYDVAVFAKSYCQYCRHTEKLIREVEQDIQNGKDLSIHFVWLDKMHENDGPLIQMELLTKTGQRTVPNIFIGGEHIGGDSHLRNLHSSGTLHKQLNLLIEAKTKDL